MTWLPYQTRVKIHNNFEFEASLGKKTKKKQQAQKRLEQVNQPENPY